MYHYGHLMNSHSSSRYIIRETSVRDNTVHCVVNCFLFNSDNYRNLCDIRCFCLDVGLIHKEEPSCVYKGKEVHPIGHHSRTRVCQPTSQVSYHCKTPNTPVGRETTDVRIVYTISLYHSPSCTTPFLVLGYLS